MMEMFEQPCLPILLYHKCPPNLDRQFEIIRKSGYRPVHLTEVAGYFERPRRMPQDLLILTFDDALVDFFDVAVPLLKCFDFPATLCVPTGRVSANSQHRALDNWENNESSTNPIMTWDELIQLKKLTKTDGSPLVEFASHSVGHVNLNDFESDEETLRYEIFDSKVALQTILGIQDPIFFCFPYGGGEGKFTNLLKEAVYAGALMVRGVKWGKYRIPRHVPDDDNENKLLIWLNDQKEIAQRFNAG